jgi:hypothetical protein
MTTFNVVPHEGVGPVRLGMSRDEARSAMALPVQSFKKTESSTALTDAYLDSCFQVFFDNEERVEYVELSHCKSFITLYNGINVFATKAEDLIEFISKTAPYDANRRELGYSYVFPALELSVWRSTMPEDGEDEEGRFFMTIGVGKSGYYS